jgi:hypothetical protein
MISVVLHTFSAPLQKVYIHTLKFTGTVSQFAGVLGKKSYCTNEVKENIKYYVHHLS